MGLYFGETYAVKLGFKKALRTRAYDRLVGKTLRFKPWSCFDAS